MSTNGWGRLHHVTEQLPGAARTTTFGYDLRGRMLSESEQQDVTVNGITKSASFRQDYSYDAADRLIQVSYSTEAADQTEVMTYSYNDLGQLDLMNTPRQSYATQLRYDRFGRVVQWRDAADTNHRAAFGAANINFRLFSLVSKTAANTVQQDLNYAGYDVSGNLKSLTDLTNYGSVPLPLRGRTPTTGSAVSHKHSAAPIRPRRSATTGSAT